MQPHDEPDTQDSPGPDSGPATSGSPVSEVGADRPLTAIEAASVAGVNERTIRRAISAGQLPATKHRGAFRISPADLAAWQAEYEAGTPPDRATDTGPAEDRTGQSAGSGPNASGQVSTGEGAIVAELWRALEDETKATIAAKDAQITQANVAKDEASAAKDETIGRLDTEVAFLREQLDQRSRELAAERERFDVIQQLALQRIEALTATVADRRHDAPERAPEPPGRDERAPEGDPSSWWASALRRVRRGR